MLGILGVKGYADGTGHQRKGEISRRRTEGKIFEGMTKINFSNFDGNCLTNTNILRHKIPTNFVDRGGGGSRGSGGSGLVGCE